MQNWVKQMKGADPYIYFCPGADETKGGKPKFNS